MSFAVMAVVLPLLAAPLLGLFGAPMAGARAHLLLTMAGFLLTLLVGYAPGTGLVHADRLGIMFGVLSGFVGLTTAIANLVFVRGAQGQMGFRSWRVYHALCQLLLGAILLGLYADNMLLLWGAVEAGTIAAAVGVGLPRTALALAAARNYLVLAGVGIALALFGTLLVYLAAQPVCGPGLPAMSLAALGGNAAHLDGRLLTLAFVFLLFGYGTVAALAPLHGWSPDAYANGPAPLTNCLNLLLVNVALLAILRFRHLLQARFAAGGAMTPPGPLLLALGLASLLLAMVSLARHRNTRRFFGASAIGHSGIAVFAFGIGGATAIFAGLLHMLLHTLAKTALFQVLIRAAALRGGADGFSPLRGTVAGSKSLGWALGACLFALTGLPPSGLFTSEFLVIGQTVQRQPVLALPLGLLLLLYALAIFRTIGRLVFDPPPPAAKPVAAGAGILFIWLHLALMFLLAFAMPLALVHTLSAIAASLQ